MTNAVRVILFALCASSLFSARLWQRIRAATSRIGRAGSSGSNAGDGSPLDVVPSRPEQTTPERPLGAEPARAAGHAGATGPALASAETWSMFQADAKHTGYLPVSLDPALFSFRWQKNVGTNFPLNPVTAGDGKVFVSLLTYFNDMPSLFALRSLDGTALWSKGFGSVFSVNPPSYAYGKVYVQTGNHGNDTFLRAFDRGHRRPRLPDAPRRAVGTLLRPYDRRRQGLRGRRLLRRHVQLRRHHGGTALVCRPAPVPTSGRRRWREASPTRTWASTRRASTGSIARRERRCSSSRIPTSSGMAGVWTWRPWWAPTTT